MLAAGAGLVNNLTDDGATPSMFAQAHHPEVPEVVTLLRAAEGKPLSSYLGANRQVFAPQGLCDGARLDLKPHLNGSKGRVLEFDVSKGRFNVLLADGASTLALKLANLEPRDAPAARGLCDGRDTGDDGGDRRSHKARQGIQLAASPACTARRRSGGEASVPADKRKH